MAFAAKAYGHIRPKSTCTVFEDRICSYNAGSDAQNSEWNVRSSALALGSLCAAEAMPASGVIALLHIDGSYDTSIEQVRGGDPPS